MSLVKNLAIRHGLGDRERRALNTLLNHGGKASWTDFLEAPEPNRMPKRTLSKALKTLVDSGIVEKRRERFKGRMTYVYVLTSKEVEEVFSKMSLKLNKEAERLFTATQNPGLSVTDRGKRLIDGVDELLRYQRALTLMAIKLAMSAPSEEKAAHRFLVLVDTFTPDAAGNAMWLCWLNKDIAPGVLEAMLPKNPEEVRTCE